MIASCAVPRWRSSFADQPPTLSQCIRYFVALNTDVTLAPLNFDSRVLIEQHVNRSPVCSICDRSTATLPVRRPLSPFV